jgi:MFS transporter, DHA1 family, multidrug resistance protein
MSESYLGWRWTQWLTVIAALSFVLVYLLATPETYAPVIRARLERKAATATTGATSSSLPVRRQNPDLARLARAYLLRPGIMLVQEPILALFTLYMGFIYGFIYLCFEAYPVAFQQLRGWPAQVAALPFLAIAVGMLLGVGVVAVHTRTRMRRKVRAHPSGDVPEERLVPMMLGSVLLPAGIFWFGWAAAPRVESWVPQVVAGVPMSCGICLIFLQSLNYVIDVYKTAANSALSVNAMFRGLLGAGFPLFAPYMVRAEVFLVIRTSRLGTYTAACAMLTQPDVQFQNLGVPWAMSLLGFLCLAMVPVPFLFYTYGVRIRQWSKFVPSN